MSSTNDTTIRDALKRKPQPKLLRKLADYIETKVKDDKFDMGNFCGTARCAFGHAPSLPAIGKLVQIKRLSYINDLGESRYYTDIRPVNPEIDKKIAKSRYKQYVEAEGLDVTVNDLVDNFDRVQYVFGITESEAYDVFDVGAWGNKSRASVAADLRALASDYDGKPA
jgi:hypothetical protein